MALHFIHDSKRSMTDFFTRSVHKYLGPSLTDGPFALSGLPLQAPLPLAECLQVRGQQAGVLLLLHHVLGLLGHLTTAVIVHRCPTAQIAHLPAFLGKFLSESQVWLHICITFTPVGVISL